MSSEAERKIRKNKVISLIVQGNTVDEIATKLKICERTVERDLAEMREHYATERTSGQIFGEMMLAMKKRQKCMWKILANSDSSNKDKINASNSLRDEDKELFRRAQSVGIVPRDTENQVNVAVQTNNEVNVQNIISQVIAEEEKRNAIPPISHT